MMYDALFKKYMVACIPRSSSDKRSLTGHHSFAALVRCSQAQTQTSKLSKAN